MHAAGENSTKNDPEIDARSPDRAAQRTEYRAEASDIQQLDQENFPGRQRYVVNTIIVYYSRSRLVCRPEGFFYNLAIRKEAADKAEECNKECNHLQFTSIVEL